MRIMCQDCYRTFRSLSSIFLAYHVMQEGQKSIVETSRPETVLVVVASLCAYSSIIFSLFSENLHALEIMGSRSGQDFPKGPVLTVSRVEVWAAVPWGARHAQRYWLR